MTADARRFDAAVEHAAYLVCSEALTNVAKHARASEVDLRIEAIGGLLRLEVSDDGRGGADVGGTGLRGISARVEELAGHLVLDSPPGRGTRLAVEIPLRADRDLSGRGDPPPVRGRLESAAVG